MLEYWRTTWDDLPDDHDDVSRPVEDVVIAILYLESRGIYNYGYDEFTGNPIELDWGEPRGLRELPATPS